MIMPNISSMSARYRTSQRLLRAQLEGEVPCGRGASFPRGSPLNICTVPILPKQLQPTDLTSPITLATEVLHFGHVDLWLQTSAPRHTGFIDSSFGVISVKQAPDTAPSTIRRSRHTHADKRAAVITFPQTQYFAVSVELSYGNAPVEVHPTWHLQFSG